MTPLQALPDEDLTDPAAAHRDALVREIGDQPIQGPAGEGQTQLGGPGQGRGDDGAALLGRIRRRSAGAHVLFQPVQTARIEAVDPVANRVAAQIHPAGDLLRLQAAHGMDDNLGTVNKGSSKRVRSRDPLNFHPLIIRQVPQPKSHGPAPKQIDMFLQQLGSMIISIYLPDAPIRRIF